MTDRERIAAVDAVPVAGTLLFTVRVDEETGTAIGGVGDDVAGAEREAILVRTDGGIACWLNYCQHLTHVRLDKGSGALVRDGEVVCTNHGATFEVDTGYCTFGPCEGAYLTAVDVAVEGGAVFLTDDGYEFVSLGPIPRDPVDLSSTSNVEF